LALLTSCATAGRGSSEETDSVWAHIARPLKYWSAGASLKARANLERGQRELDARNYRVAIAALNRALWDLERIPDRALRLSELQVAYKALRSAYLALGVSDVAEEHRSMAQALANAVARERSSDGAQALGRAKQAYATARFRDAVKKLRQALIELEDVSEAEARVVQLADARCYLALSYFATEKHALVREELRRLWALEPSMAECIREAPPGVRKVIGEIQRRQKDL
jgi:tetratricopeptide (TPR) repeat protein